MRLASGGLPVRIANSLLGGAMVVLAILYLFNFVMMRVESYIYAVMALSIPILFLNRRATPKAPDTVPWYDLLLAAAGLGIGIFCTLSAQTAYTQGWEFGAPVVAFVAGLVLLGILLEGTRRAFGWLLFGLCGFFMIEPLFAGIMPGPLAGAPATFTRLISYHVYGYDGLLGPVSTVSGKLLIGFLLLAGMLQVSGGGQFFLDFALSIIGRTRGAPAKVSVISSGFFSMLSGNPIPNILTTGAFTIPAMKKAGYARHYAAAVEACASTGGIIMPPVLGTAAFLMVGMTGIPYWEICIAAVVPAILYYLILYVQADSYAGRKAIAGLTAEQLPRFWHSLLLGIPYLTLLFVLTWLLAVARMDAQAPFYAIAVLLVASMIRKETRFNLRQFWGMFEAAFKMMGELFVLFYALTLIYSGLVVTGVIVTLGFNLVSLAGEMTFLLPLMAMLAGYILGMGMPNGPVYLLLAITLGPALVSVGFPVMATHLLFVYVGMMSIIIPPVATASITAGRLAGEPNVWKVSATAMRLGIGLFILPLYFIFNPALLIGQAPIMNTVIAAIFTALGFVLISGGFEGYLFRFKFSMWQSVAICITGAILALIPVWLAR